MSKRHRLESLVRRIERLTLRVKADQMELSKLEKKASFMRATIAVEEMPDWKRNALVLSGMSTNPIPRQPVCNDSDLGY